MGVLKGGGCGQGACVHVGDLWLVELDQSNVSELKRPGLLSSTLAAVVLRFVGVGMVRRLLICAQAG